jgi:hypothetical protein
VPEEPLGGASGSVRGSARRSELPLLKRAPRIPDPGQYVDLRTENGAWRKGFRTLWVATEDEYLAAAREDHSAPGVPWSTERLRLTSPRPPWNLSRVSVRWAAGGTQIHIGR